MSMGVAPWKWRVFGIDRRWAGVTIEDERLLYAQAGPVIWYFERDLR